MKYAPWIIVAITSTISAGLLLRGPNVVTKEVPVEVIRTVTKEVPVEVIKIVTKEVPIEVIKTVTKEVERQLTSQETYAINQYNLLMAATPMGKSSDALRGVLALTVDVALDEVLSKQWSAAEIKQKFKLELRKIGIEVVEPSDNKARGTLTVFGDALTNSSGTTTWTLRWSIRTRSTSFFWDFKYHEWTPILADGGQFGTFGSDKATDAQRNAVDASILELSNQLLEANPIKRN